MKVIVWKALSIPKLDFDHTTFTQCRINAEVPSLSPTLIFFCLSNFFSVGWTPTSLKKTPGFVPEIAKLFSNSSCHYVILLSVP